VQRNVEAALFRKRTVLAAGSNNGTLTCDDTNGHRCG
jgi:hypothetical protein